MNKKSIAFHRNHFLNVMYSLGKIEAGTMQVFSDERQEPMDESQFLAFLMFNLQAEHREKTVTSEELAAEYARSKFSDVEAEPHEQVTLTDALSYEELMEQARTLIKEAEAIKSGEVVKGEAA